MYTQLVDQTHPTSPKGKEESPIGTSAPVMIDAVDGSLCAICIRYIAPKDAPKTEPESESKTDPVTEPKTDTIVDETPCSKVEEGDNDDIPSDLFGPSDDESGNAPIARNCQQLELIQPNGPTRVHFEKARAEEMEYPPTPGRPRTLSRVIFSVA